MNNLIDIPTKTRHYSNESLDSTRWDGIELRSDDIIIATSMKTGTTWMERILSLLIHQDPFRLDNKVMNAPWPDAIIFEPLEVTLEKIDAIKHRRFFKTHIPLDGLDFNENVKYIHVSRDTRDAFMSLINHWSLISDFLEKNNRQHPPKFETQGDIHELWKKYTSKSTFEWESDGWPYWSNNHYTETFWPYRYFPNILFVHFNDLLQDLEGQMNKVAKFLDIDLPDDKELWSNMVNAATFNSMKRDGDKLIPKFKKVFKGGAKSFMNKGKNGRWKDIFNEKDKELYQIMRNRYEDGMMDWIEKGSIITGDPQKR